MARLHVDGPWERGCGEVQDGNADAVDVSDAHFRGVWSGEYFRR